MDKRWWPIAALVVAGGVVGWWARAFVQNPFAFTGTIEKVTIDLK